MKIRTILIDDEPLAITELRQMLKKYEDIQIIDTAQTVNDALKKIEIHKPHLIFLDINMPGKTGFELLEELFEVPIVIFATAYDNFAIKAFEVNALDYILKPINEKRLQDAVEKVKHLLSNNVDIENSHPLKGKIFIKDREQCHFVSLYTIFVFESVGNYVRVHYSDKKPLIHRSLNFIESKLTNDLFFRANRQFIFNVNFVENIENGTNNNLVVKLKNGLKVDLSQRQSIKFKELAKF